MSSHLPRHPAWSGLNPDVRAQGIDEALSLLIQEACERRGQVWRIAGDGSTSCGYYRLESDDPAQDVLFVKVVPESSTASQVAADTFARYLEKKGICCNPLLDGYPRSLPGSLCILAHPWVEATSKPIDGAGLLRIGERLAAMHQHLRHNPLAAQVKESCGKRKSRFQRRLDIILRTGSAPGPYSARFVTLAQSMPEAFASEDPHGQIIHGDLNAGNVLMRSRDAEPVFLDFEDAKHSWHSPLVDLVFALERLVFFGPCALETGEAARMLLRGYYSSPETSGGLLPGEISRIRYWLALRSMCIMAEAEAQGDAWPVAEWDKFAFILDDIEKRRDMTSFLEKEFALD